MRNRPELDEACQKVAGHYTGSIRNAALHRGQGLGSRELGWAIMALARRLGGDLGAIGEAERDLLSLWGRELLAK